MTLYMTNLNDSLQNCLSTDLYVSLSSHRTDPPKYKYVPKSTHTSVAIIYPKNRKYPKP